MINYPCRECDRRTVGCHSTCKEYLETRAKHVGDVQRSREELKGTFQAVGLRKESIAKTKRKAHDRKER